MERLGVARCDVDDARQRVWLTALRHIERMRPGSEGAFLRMVARREAGHVRRTYRRRSEVPSAEFDELASAALPSDELVARRQQLEHAHDVLQNMDTELRRVLLLSEVDDASTRHIAGMLDIPLGTVKSRLRRARADGLRRGLAREGRDVLQAEYFRGPGLVRRAFRG